MAPPGRQKARKSGKVFFAGWIPGINSYSDIRQEVQQVTDALRVLRSLETAIRLRVVCPDNRLPFTVR